MSDPAIAFTDACRMMGLDVHGLAIMDGQHHRVRIIGKKSGKSGFYVGFADGRPAGFIQNHTTGDTLKWKFEGTVNISAADRAAMEQNRKDRENLRIKGEQDAARIAARIWKRAERADPYHPYLIRKRIAAHHIRQIGKILIVPCVNHAGVIQSVQKINPEGEKRFLKNGSVAGCRFRVGGITPNLYIAEGFATAATIHQLTGRACFVAYNAGNLMPVAQAVRAKYPNAEIIIAADNDRAVEIRLGQNPGRDKAEQAAEVARCTVRLPIFGDDNAGTDWNDFAASYGDDEAKNCLMDGPIDPHEAVMTAIQGIAEDGETATIHRRTLEKLVRRNLLHPEAASMAIMCGLQQYNDRISQ